MDLGHAIVVISWGAMRVDNDHFSNALLRLQLSSRFALQKTAEKGTILLVIASWTSASSTKIGFFRPPIPPLSLVIMDKVLFYTHCNQFGVFSNLLSLFLATMGRAHRCFTQWPQRRLVYP